MTLGVEDIIAEYDITTEGVPPLKPTNGLKALDPSAALKAACCNRSHLPILQHVFVKDGWAEATDLELGIRLKCDLTDGFYQHMGKRLMPSADAETAAEWADEYPIIPGDGKPIATVNLAELSAKLATAAKFTSNEQERQLPSGVLIQAEAETRACIVGTDSHRLHRAYLDTWQTKTESKCSLIVPFPAKIAKVLLALSEESPETTEITVEGREETGVEAKEGEEPNYTNVIFRSSRGRICARLIDGTFPAVDKVFPSAADYRIEVDTAAFRLAASRIAAVSAHNDDGMKIGVCFARRDRLSLTCKSPDGGIYHECLPASAVMLDGKSKPLFEECVLQMPMWLVDSKDEECEFIHSVAFGINAHYLRQVAEAICHIRTDLILGATGYVVGLSPVTIEGRGGVPEKPVKAKTIGSPRKQIAVVPHMDVWQMTAAEYDALEPDVSTLKGGWTVKAERWDRDRQPVLSGSIARLSTYRLVFTPDGEPRVEDVETLEIHHYTNGEGVWKGPIRMYHPVAVLKALSEGRPVPQKVLKEYAWAFKEPEDAELPKVSV